MKRAVLIALAFAVTLVFAACGETDHGGYASGEEGCESVGAKVKSGPVIEGDEIEYVCDNGKIVEAQRNWVRGDEAGDHKNPWTIDEDSLQCPDGTEITVGDEARFLERCNKDGTAERDPNNNYGYGQQPGSPGYYDDDLEGDD